MSGFYESQFTGAEIDQAILYARYSGLKNASDYSKDAVYSVGSYCINDGKLYRCINAISSAEPWTLANWEETSVDAELIRKADLDNTGKINSSQLPSMDYVPTSEKGVANGVATLGEDGKVPAEQVDAYSQSDSISAGTRTALNLSETATPDAALAEIARQLSGTVESTDYPGCYYRTVDGVTEWVNPPMMLGVEYRTTERYLGEPVYVKAVDFGNAVADGDITVTDWLPNSLKIIRTMGGVAAVIPWEEPAPMSVMPAYPNGITSSDTNWNAYIKNADRSKATVYTGSSNSGRKVIVTAYYTKF